MGVPSPTNANPKGSSQVRQPVNQPSLFVQSAPPIPRTDRHLDVQEAFDRFWSAYPRRVGKADARKAFTDAVKRAGGIDRMLDTIVVWTAEWQARPQFCPYPATWLRRDGWDDDPPVRHVQQRQLTSRETALAVVARRHGLIA